MVNSGNTSSDESFQKVNMKTIADLGVSINQFCKKESVFENEKRADSTSFCSCHRQCTSFLKYFEVRSKIESKDDKGITTLAFAAGFGYLDIAQFITERLKDKKS